MGDRLQKGFVVLGAVLLLASCGVQKDAAGEKQPGNAVPPASEPKKKPIPVEKRAELAAGGDKRIAEAANRFGLQLLAQRIKEEPGQNAVISPVSVATALSMTLNGASGATKDAMSKTLGLDGLSLEELNSGYAKLNELLRQPGSGIELSTANSLWTQKGWPFRKEYLDRVQKAYGAVAAEKDFHDDAVPKELNGWVDKQTHGKISKIVDDPLPGDLKDQLKLLLINAIYFNGSWQQPFEPSATQEDEFTNGDGSKSRVLFMEQRDSFEYAKETGYEAIRLPYGEGQMSMLVVLPDAKADVGSVRRQLLADPAVWLKRLKPQHGDIRLPKFRVEGDIELSGTLKALGMGAAFDYDQADFSGMADLAAGKLAISEVKHKTYVDVSEKGTEAAAVTSVSVKTAAAVASNGFMMKVDRPFLFAIEDMQSGALLFVGQMEKL